MFNWMKSFWKGSRPPATALVEASPMESLDRVARALPQTHDLPRLLTLVPPAAPERAEAGRGLGPDPIAECSITFTAEHPFRCDDIRAMFTRERRQELRSPTIYVVAPDGFTAYLNANDGPTEGIAFLASWPMYDGADTSEELVLAAADTIASWLMARPEGFRYDNPLARDIAPKQFSRARDIIAVEPEYVAIIASGRDEEAWFDGVATWNALHAMDLKWGDMDCFHWLAAGHDQLFTVEVDDERFGYVLPEEIAAGRQHFRTLRFIFSPARSPDPFHVLEQMIRAAECFQEQSGCQLSCDIDGKDVDGPEALEHAIVRMSEELRSLGTQPGSSAVCQLR